MPASPQSWNLLRLAGRLAVLLSTLGLGGLAAPPGLADEPPLATVEPLPGTLTLPDPPALEALLKSPPRPVTVYEPHLSRDGAHTTLTYVGYPAAWVLDLMLGTAWHKPGIDVEFIARDGYVAHIRQDKFLRYPAYLVFGLAGGGDFVVDNPLQHERRVPLGPYYLVWENRAYAELLADGASDWPYQVHRVGLSEEGRRALLPGDLADRHEEAAALTRKHCLTCHRVAGYGGGKHPVDLLDRAVSLGEAAFRQWVLDPAAGKPGTTMPPLLAHSPTPARQEAARQIYDYLRARAARR